MEPDLFKNLPPEIISEILLRLPVVSIPISKCVCKRWLHLLESDAFVKSHFARSAPALVVMEDSNSDPPPLNLDLESYNPLTQYDFPYHRGRIRNCFNGFLFIRVGFDKLVVCNPITREVIKLDLPTDPQQSTLEVSALGFGASEVVCIKRRKLECHVYTLGTGSWRRLEGNPYVYQFDLSGAFVNGNLHWIATIGEDSSWISCLDLETECFSFFKAPYHAQGLPFIRGTTISALSGCLWFCKVASEFVNYGGRRELTIWIMKEYGVDESWSMEYVIRLDDSMRPYYPGIRYVDPIKVFENGDLLMLVVVSVSDHLFYYSKKTKTMQSIDLFGAGETSGRVNCGLFTPTYVSLKTLGLGVENVTSF
ncbi:F-box/kelch-repeat protein At3g23880-like [Salvia miltiorrhiza]|uniref:F-box/kelch-repeat protein At3g23880-like n=1 Tax=Salvia miltiorrhiza TaxID=226208 RepID=UPI0025ACC073|nr:F-box/kelch-repeat protein At3g23880-like [Salvia miltiorrhiza]